MNLCDSVKTSASVGGSCEMHPEDDKDEKNKKRIVKTHAQVEALEKFYNDHKYPTESMKIQVAESIGLTEKQVSGWFCHRRLKDQKLMNGENYATGKQDRSSGVIQDCGNGHRQDSCCSPNQVEYKNFDNREVESGRLTPKEFSAPGFTYEHGIHYAGNYNHADDTSSGSSSSLWNIPCHQNGHPSDAATSKYVIPKFPTDVKGTNCRSGPSGYLKVKGQVENAAITAVKRQLGKHYREDGPPLGVVFDPVPPGAFESSIQDPVEAEDYCTGGAGLPTSPDFLNVQQNLKFCKGSEYLSSMATFNIDGMDFKMRHGADIPDSYINQKCKIKTSWSDNYTYMDKRVAVGENVEYELSNLTMKRNEYHNSGEKGLSREIIKDGKTYSNRRIRNENQVKIPFKNDLTGPQRIREGFPQQRHLQTPIVDNLSQTYQIIRSATEMPSS